jgi:phytoene dehydrogenase-like protein
VRLGSGARSIGVENGRAVRVETRDDQVVEADLIVSDVGIEGTAALLEPEFAAAFPTPPPQRSAPGITAFVASTEPFYDHPAVVVAGTRCVCLVSTPTLVAPELAPNGWHFTETISTFTSSFDDSDPKGEMERHMADVDDLLPGWRDRGRLLQTATYRGTWPIYRTWPGHDSQDRFPLPGLALVGDAVKPLGWPGTGASAEGARMVVEEILTGAAGVTT